MKTRWIATGAAPVVACVALAALAGQTWKPLSQGDAENLQHREGEITVEQALKRCEAFLEKMGRPAPTAEPIVSRRKFLGRMASDYGVHYLGEAAIYVDAKTGAVVGYTRETLAAPRDAMAKGPSRFKTDIQVEIYLRQLAKLLGASDKLKLAGAHRHTVDPRRASAIDVPSIDATFEVMPYGYPMLAPCDGMSLIIDPVDGALIYYNRHGPRPYTVESHAATVKYDRAVAVAKPTADKYSVGMWRKTDPRSMTLGELPPAKPSFLAYVTPNGQFGAPEYTDKPVRLRLAWVLRYPREEQIWIDAGDGKVLGGVYHSQGS